jgi:hypothetical protein
MSRIIISPPLQPEVPAWPPAPDGVDGIIRTVRAMYLAGLVSWRGAGRLHDVLCELRDGEAPR